jgi:hypothetical protein
MPVKPQLVSKPPCNAVFLAGIELTLESLPMVGMRWKKRQPKFPILIFKSLILNVMLWEMGNLSFRFVLTQARNAASGFG